MTHTFSQEEPALIIIAGAGIAAFVMAVLWGKVTRQTMNPGKVKMLAIVFGLITVCGMGLAFVM